MSTYPGAYQGASSNRLQGAWLGAESDPNDDWRTDAQELASRAADAVRNDPVLCALQNAKTMGEQGPRGLRFRSLVDIGADDEITSKQESELREAIEDVIAEASEGTQLDASGLCTRRELEASLSESSAIAGECFEIRNWIEGRPGATINTCWRMIRRDRISNPPGMVDSPTLFQGIALGSSGPRGVWVGPPRRLWSNKPQDWAFVPWHDDNGLPMVIHRIGKRTPGSIRGLSMYAPQLYLATQVKKTIDAYVVAKRIQACHPIFIKCADPVQAAKKDRNGVVWGPNTTLEPGKIYYIGEDGEISFPNWTFQGADMREFLDTLYRNEFAAWGLPIDVVLAQLGKTNMAASRSAWLQYYRQCERWQDDHIEQATAIIDLCIVQEAVLTGRLVLPAGMTVRQAMKGRYIRPPRSMPDPLKEANAVKAWAELQRDLTGLFAESGVDFRESTKQRQEDDRWLAAHDLEIAEDAAPSFGAPAHAAPADDADPIEEAAPEPDKQENPDAPAPV